MKKSKAKSVGSDKTPATATRNKKHAARSADANVSAKSPLTSVSDKSPSKSPAKNDKASSGKSKQKAGVVEDADADAVTSDGGTRPTDEDTKRAAHPESPAKENAPLDGSVGASDKAGAGDKAGDCMKYTREQVLISADLFELTMDSFEKEAYFTPRATVVNSIAYLCLMSVLLSLCVVYSCLVHICEYRPSGGRGRGCEGRERRVLRVPRRRGAEHERDPVLRHV